MSVDVSFRRGQQYLDVSSVMRHASHSAVILYANEKITPVSIGKADECFSNISTNLPNLPWFLNARRTFKGCLELAKMTLTKVNRVLHPVD